MRMSQLFMPTLKEVPKEATIASHQLMLRAGLIRKISSGLYSFLPLGFKVLNKVIHIIRSEMDNSGAQEFLQPILIPKELWEESGRFAALGDLMMKLKDRGGREVILGPTHEEVFTDIVRNELRSYKELPFNLYQIGTKFRDEIRPRFGVMRAREFIMKDAYSFHTNDECLDKTYRLMAETYNRIFKRCGLNAVRVSADSGAMGGSGSEEFMVPSEIGEETIVLCPKCGYVANVEKAECFEDLKTPQGDKKDFEKIDTPNVRTIEELVEFLKVEANSFIKTLIYQDENNNPVVALIRGDLDVNEVKLANSIGATEVIIADDSTVYKITGAPVGFAGPIGLKNVRIIADKTVEYILNGYTGANEKDKHYKNVNPGKDFVPEKYVDLRLVKEGDLCPQCREKLGAFKGIEVGHIFKLGKKYTQALNVTYLDETQKSAHPTMGCYGIGVGRTMACVIEQLHDDNGIVFPMSIAPYHVVIIPLGKSGDETFELAEKIYQELKDTRLIEPLLDDRDERAGVKFKDADLIGVPIRITIGKKGLAENSVEYKLRDSEEVKLVKVEEVIRLIKSDYETEMKKLICL